MEIKDHIIARAEPVFDAHGFAGTGMDQLTHAAQVSTRTLYKYLDGKTELICAVLDARRRRFFKQFEGHGVDSLFATLETWVATEGARGCLFLRAHGEMGADEPSVADQVAIYRRDLRDLVARAVAHDLGQDVHADLVDEVLLLFEGATSAASYRGPTAFAAARRGAARVMAHKT